MTDATEKKKPLNPRQNFLSTVAPRKLTGEVIKSVGLRIASGMTIEGVAALNNISRDGDEFLAPARAGSHRRD